MKKQTKCPSAERPKNFQGAERPKQFTPAERWAPGAHFSEATSIPPKSYALGFSEEVKQKKNNRIKNYDRSSSKITILLLCLFNSACNLEIAFFNFLSSPFLFLKKKKKCLQDASSQGLTILARLLKTSLQSTKHTLLEILNFYKKQVFL